MSPEITVGLIAAIAAAFVAGYIVARAASRERTPASDRPTPGVDYSDRLELADRLQVGLVVFDARDRVVAANDSAGQLLGARPGSLIGKSVMETFVDHTAEQVVTRARRGGASATELSIGGEPARTLRLHTWPDGAGHVWVALEDYSELRRLQRIRTEFIDNLSHELRTPLTTIRLLTESLALEADRAAVPGRMRESIDKIDVETGHLVQMVHELLDLATIEHGDAPLARDEVDVGAVVAATLSRLRTYAERQGVALRDEGDVASDERLVMGDAQRLGQALANIVQNAIKFSSPGDDVLLRVTADPTNVIVEVADRGPGIPRAERSRIFERFYKVDRARSRGGAGTGLGLSIARHIVERHGGRIWVLSEEGAGSRFFVSLPRTERAG